LFSLFFLLEFGLRELLCSKQRFRFSVFCFEIVVVFFGYDVSSLVSAVRVFRSVVVV
jgi:hypothetical protein